MELELVEFRDMRDRSPRTSKTYSLTKMRVGRLIKIFSKKDRYFALMNKSEQIDFLLYYLEKFVTKSEYFKEEVNRVDLGE